MIDIRPVFFIIGWLLVMLAGAMLLPAAVETGQAESESTVFLIGAAITLFVGGLLVAVCSSVRPHTQLYRYLTLRQSFLIAVLSWIVLGAFAALPLLLLSDTDLSVTDAMFEAVSGITTTGSTVLTGLDDMAPGILLWRALLQWLGGMGIIVTAIAVSPLLRVGGMQIFRIESSDRSEKVLPRAAQIAGYIGVIYLIMTAALTGALTFAGLGLFDAVVHAMTTIATGGFSTMDGSVGAFGNPAVEWIVIAGMVAGSLPFVLYIQLMRGRRTRLLADSQVRAFLGILGVSIAVLTVAHALANAVDPLEALRQVAFNTTSYMTGTGYVTADFATWGGFAPTALFCLMFIGGCAGSTTCGIKVFRLQVLFAEARAQLGRLLHPHGVYVPHYAGKPITASVAASVTSFVFLFIAAFAAITAGLGIAGLDLETAVTGAATAIANVGPGLGETIGPQGNFSSLNDPAKWLLICGMLLGRLEVLSVLLLFTPRFWRS